jgi:hypothetical protein
MTVNTNFMGGGETALARTPADALLSAINVDILSGLTNGWFDAGVYTAMNVTLIGGATITAGAVTFEQTNDPTSAGRPLPYRDASSVTAAGSVAAVTVTSAFNQHYIVPITARYIRIRISTAFTGGATGVRAIAEMTRNYIAADMNNGVTATISGTAAVNLNSTTAPTVHTLNSAASTNLTSVKATAGRVYTITLSNQNAAARFFKLYNKASAPVPGTDIPVAVFPVAASASVILDFDTFGMQFGTGIAYAITGAIGDADATAITAGDFKVNMQYV